MNVGLFENTAYCGEKICASLNDCRAIVRRDAAYRNDGQAESCFGFAEHRQRTMDCGGFGAGDEDAPEGQVIGATFGSDFGEC